MLLNILLWFIFLNLIFFSIKAILLYFKNIKLLTKTIPNNVQAISFHTYKPKNSIVPLRGKIIANYAYRIAQQLNVPIILSVGHTVPNESRTESEIYRDYIASLPKYNGLIKIIITDNPNTKDTHREVTTTFNRCLKNNFTHIAIIALTPHLILRIIPYWQKINSNQKIQIHFNGILGPKKYIFWELIMLVLEFYIPPNSQQRKFLLNLVNRRG